MSNRTKALERSKVGFEVDCLTSLMDSCRRNGRPAKFPPKPEKIYFDADRFRWLFATGIYDEALREELSSATRRGWTLQQFRDRIDQAMKENQVD